MIKRKDEPFIFAEDLTKVYKGRPIPALNKVSFTVGKGELVSVIGKNGAGKSTLLGLLVCQRRKTSGTLRMFGMNPERSARRIMPKIGYLPQDPSLHDKLTVRENLNYFSSTHLVPADIRFLIETFGLSSFVNSRFEHLSGGQKQRACLACVLTGNPDMIVLDEPATGFDPNMRDEIWRALSNLRDAGKTILLSTHNVSEAMLYSDRILYLDGGHLIYDGPTSGLVSDLRVTVHDPEHLLEGLPNIAETNGSMVEIVVDDTERTSEILEMITARGITSESIKFTGGEHVRVRGEQ